MEVVFGIGAVLLVVILLSLAGFLIQLWALVDAIRRSEEELASKGGRMLWVVVLAVSLIAPGFGTVLALVYLFAIRPRTPARR